MEILQNETDFRNFFCIKLFYAPNTKLQAKYKNLKFKKGSHISLELEFNFKIEKIFHKLSKFYIYQYSRSKI